MANGESLSAEGIQRLLKTPGMRVEYHSVIGSTSTALKERAAAGEREGLVIAAGSQIAGRGRMGRSFYSPAGTGLYMSLLLRPACSAEKCGLLTPAAAVAAAEAIEAMSGQKTQIKWVNDVLLEGRKVCGILTETSIDARSGRVDWAVVGIGVNIAPPAEGFPADIADRAGAVFGADEGGALRCELAAAILDRLAERYKTLGSEDCFKSYVNRSCVLGKNVRLVSPGKAPEAATVLAIERDYALRVRLADGTERCVNSGEVSVRPAE